MYPVPLSKKVRAPSLLFLIVFVFQFHHRVPGGRAQSLLQHSLHWHNASNVYSVICIHSNIDTQTLLQHSLHWHNTSNVYAVICMHSNINTQTLLQRSLHWHNTINAHKTVATKQLDCVSQYCACQMLLLGLN